MSKKKKTTQNFKLKHPREEGKFYYMHDKNGGHPVYVYYADTVNNIYYVLRFTHAKRKGRIRMKHNIDPNSSEEQWMVKKPEVVSYDDMIYVEKYSCYRIHPDDIEMVIKYQKFNLNKKMDGRCESQQGVSKQMPSSTENIKTKKDKNRK